LSKKCSLKAGTTWRYFSEGTARTPGSASVAPPSCTARAFAGPYACAGSWQDAQAILPEADSARSENSARPSAVIVFTSGRCSQGVE